MKYLLILLIGLSAFGQSVAPNRRLNFQPVSGAAASISPTLVQWVSGPNSHGGASGAGDYTIQWGEATLAGNLLCMGMTCGTGPTITITNFDSSGVAITGDIWRLATNAVADGETYRGYFVTNGTGGCWKTTIHVTSTAAFMQAGVGEWAGVADFDKANLNSATSASMSGGAITPTQSGDMYFHWGFSDGNVPTSYKTNFNANINWEFVDGGELFDGSFMVWGVNTSSSAVTPTVTQAPSSLYQSVGMAFKASTSRGILPTKTPRIIGTKHSNPDGTASLNVTTQMATRGNLLVASYNSGGAVPTNITSTPANTWTNTGAKVSNGGVCMFWYCAVPANSNMMTYTVNRDFGSADYTILMYDVIGMNTVPFDVDATGTGNQTVAGNITGPTVTPTTSTGIVFSQIAVQLGTIAGVTGSWKLDNTIYTANGISGPQDADENNGWSHLDNSSTSAKGPVWTEETALAAGLWAARTAAFKGP